MKLIYRMLVRAGGDPFLDGFRLRGNDIEDVRE